MQRCCKEAPGQVAPEALSSVPGAGKPPKSSCFHHARCIWLSHFPMYASQLPIPLSLLEPPPRLRSQGTHVGSDGPEPPAYLIQAGNETRGRTGEAKALLDGGEAAFEVGAVQELAELQKAMAEHEHLGEDTLAREDPGQ